MSRVRILMAVALVLLPLSHAQCDPGFYENEQQECTACASGQYQVRWGAAAITGRLRLQFSSRDWSTQGIGQQHTGPLCARCEARRREVVDMGIRASIIAVFFLPFCRVRTKTATPGIAAPNVAAASMQLTRALVPARRAAQGTTPRSLLRRARLAQLGSTRGRATRRACSAPLGSMSLTVASTPARIVLRGRTARPPALQASTTVPRAMPGSTKRLQARLRA